MSNEKNEKSSSINDTLVSSNIKDKINEDFSYNFLKQKRKFPSERERDDLKEEHKKNEVFCEFCKCILNSITKNNLNNDNNKINIGLNNLKINEKKQDKNNIFDILSNMNFKEQEKILFQKYQNSCDLCIQKLFIYELITNMNLINTDGFFPLLETGLNGFKKLIKNKYINEDVGEDLKLILLQNKEVERKLKETLTDLSNLSKKININKEFDKNKINEVNKKFEENIEELKENNKLLLNYIETINENKFNKINSEKNTKEASDNYSQKKGNFQISDKDSITFKSKSVSKNNCQKKYIIFTKNIINESKFQKLPKDKLTKNFKYDSFNQLKNYIHNLPSSINSQKYMINNEINGKNCQKSLGLINSLSDIKDYENSIKKGKNNTIIYPSKNRAIEVENEINRLKQFENNIYNLNKDYNTQNNNNLPNNNNLSNNNLYNNNIINNNLINNSNSLENKTYNPILNNMQNSIGNNKINNNIEINDFKNQINNKDLLLNYLISSYEINQRLLTQINPGNNFLNNPITGILNKNNSVNDLLNIYGMDTNINLNQNQMNKITDNPPIIPAFSYNSQNQAILNPLNQISNNMNDKLNFFNNMSLFYSPNPMDFNLNKFNLGEFNLNEIPKYENLNNLAIDK